MPYIEIKSLPIIDKDKQRKTILEIVNQIENKTGILKSRLTVMWTYIDEGLMFNGANLVSQIEKDKNGPIVYVHTVEGKSKDDILNLCDAICCAISENLEIIKENISIIVNSVNRGYMYSDGKYL